DQTTGDIDDCLPNNDKWKVCFTLPVEDECETNMDATITMRTFSDGELGVNISLACAYDQEEVLPLAMVCCINPTVQNISEKFVCSGDTLILFPETNIIPPVTYSWGANPENGIEGATSGTELSSFYQILKNETNEILEVEYILWAEGPNCEAEPISFVVHVYPLPTSRITISGANIVCSGSTVTLNFESTGTPPYAIELTRDNQFFANVLSESQNLTIQIDPVFSGRFRVGSMRDAFCEGEGLGFVNVTVKPVGSTIIDTSICDGESVTVGMETFDEPGNHIITLENFAANGCDSVISLSVGIIPSNTEIINELICGGDTLFVLGEPYTESTHEIIEFIGPLGCPDYIDLTLVVQDTFTDVLNQTICGGDTLNFEGVAIFQSGTYSHVEETMPGCFSQIILNLTVLPELSINDLSIVGDHGINDGAILVEINGGSPPYTFLWSNGQTFGSLFNLMHGNYSLTVTDHLGCTEDFDFVVPMVTSIQEENNPSKIKIWPSLINSESKIYIYNPNGAHGEINSVTWWNLNGQSIGQSDISIPQSNSLFEIQVPSNLSSGLYFISLSNKDGQTSWFKIIKS
ncbi:MAG TPA: PKD-like domain-containing protein, partial [Saprospiraceae bacterium]|nr:PKD-like domain-containing protein [Saprospiraceae bacterium]